MVVLLPTVDGWPEAEVADPLSLHGARRPQGRRPSAGRQVSVESPSDAGLHVPQRIHGWRSTAATWPGGRVDAAGHCHRGGRLIVEEADRGSPVFLKNGCAPR
jgi:hypothetical protein